jgi:hypothetical protein
MIFKMPSSRFVRNAVNSSLIFTCITIVSFKAGAQELGSASSFGVLGGSTVTNTGPSVVNGDLGVSPGTAITGFPPGSVNGTIHDSDAVALQAQTDALTGYNALAGLAVTQNLTGQDLGSRTLLPGVYKFDSSAELTGSLRLNGLADPNSEFVFEIGSTLTTASASSIVLENSAYGYNVFWQVGSSATLGTTTMFAGSVVADQSVTLNTGADDPCGGMYALNGAVTMDTNTIGGGCIPSSPTTPEPGAFAYLVCVSVASAAAVRRRHLRNNAA